MKFILNHTHLGFCWLDLVALIVLLVVIGVFIYQHRKLKKEEKELQDLVTAVHADTEKTAQNP